MVFIRYQAIKVVGFASGGLNVGEHDRSWFVMLHIEPMVSNSSTDTFLPTFRDPSML